MPREGPGHWERFRAPRRCPTAAIWGASTTGRLKGLEHPDSGRILPGTPRGQHLTNSLELLRRAGPAPPGHGPPSRAPGPHQGGPSPAS